MPTVRVCVALGPPILFSLRVSSMMPPYLQAPACMSAQGLRTGLLLTCSLLRDRSAPSGAFAVPSLHCPRGLVPLPHEVQRKVAAQKLRVGLEAVRGRIVCSPFHWHVAANCLHHLPSEQSHHDFVEGLCIELRVLRVHELC